MSVPQYTCRGQMVTVELVLSFHLDNGARTELDVDGRC